VFLVGAYQETLGDLHNLLGDTNVVGVHLEKGKPVYTHEVEGDTVADVLTYVEYDPEGTRLQVPQLRREGRDRRPHLAEGTPRDPRSLPRGARRLHLLRDLSLLALKAFIFQSHLVESRPAIIEALKSAALTKIGFGLGGDLHQISSRFGIRPASIVDLDRSFRKLGYRNSLGAKSAVAMFFNRRLLKSKSVTTSNWASPRLTERQLIYAANDAYAGIRIFHALKENGPETDVRP
jgi:hypothetical protein